MRASGLKKGADTGSGERATQAARRAALERIIADGSLPDTDRAAAVFDMAGEVYFSFGNSAGTDAQNADNERMDATSERELSAFIGDAMANRAGPHKIMKIGNISETAQNFIKEKFGFSVKFIKADNYGVIHAKRKNTHNLEPDDLLHAVDVINTGNNAVLSPKRHQEHNVLIFKKDIGGELTVLADFYPQYETLVIFDAWRKKPRNSTTADTSEGTPSANVRNAEPSASYDSLSPSSLEKSSEKNAPDDPAVRILFQEGERNLVDEAAGFDSWEEWRNFVLYEADASVGEKDAELYAAVEEGDEALNAWFKTFWEGARKAKRDGAAAERAAMSPADADREFLDIVSDNGAFDEFVAAAARLRNDTMESWRAADEAEGAEFERMADLRDDVTRRMRHYGWQAVFNAGGKISNDTQRDRLRGLVKANPREYRALYSRLMDAPELAVGEADTAAAALRHKLKDVDKEDIDRLSPEKLADLAARYDADRFAEKVRTGKAKFNDPGEKRYIRQRNERIAELEKAVEAAEAAREEDNTMLARIAGRDFLEVFDRAARLKAQIDTRNEKLDRALRRSEKDEPRARRALAALNSSYAAAEKELEALARVHRLEIDVREALNDRKVKEALAAQKQALETAAEQAALGRAARDDARLAGALGEADAKMRALREEYADYVKSAKREAKLNQMLVKRAAADTLRAWRDDMKARREDKELRDAKAKIIGRTFRATDAKIVNHEQGRAIAFIQRAFQPSMLDVVDRFIGGAEAPYIAEIHAKFRTDAEYRESVLAGRPRRSREKLEATLLKDSLTAADKRYLFGRLKPEHTEAALGLDEVARRHHGGFWWIKIPAFETT